MAEESRLFVFLVCFWTLLTFFSNVFHYQLTGTDISVLRSDGFNVVESGNVLKDVLAFFVEGIDQIPIVNYFTPLLRMVTYQYADFPLILSAFLDLLMIISAYVVFKMVTPD